jgi:hypothetical protein
MHAAPPASHSTARDLDTIAPSHHRTVAPSQCPAHYLLHKRKPPVALLFYLASCARDRNRLQVRLQTKRIEGHQSGGGGSPMIGNGCDYARVARRSCHSSSTCAAAVGGAALGAGRRGTRSQNRIDGSRRMRLQPSAPAYDEGLFFLFQGGITCGWFLLDPYSRRLISRLLGPGPGPAGFFTIVRFRLSPIQRGASYRARHRHFLLSTTPLLQSLSATV